MALDRKNPLHRLAASPPRLEGGIDLSVSINDGGAGTVTLSRGKVKATLCAAGLSVAYRSGLERLLSKSPEVELVVVDEIPRGFPEAAKEAQVSYLDVRGRGYVASPNLVYVASALPRFPRQSNSRSLPFAPAASRVARTLLESPERVWRIAELASHCRINPGNVHRNLASLVDGGFVERDMNTYLLTDPGSLLDAWADQQAHHKSYVSLPIEGDLRAFVEKLLDEFKDAIAVSGELAAELYAPYLPAQSAIVHVLSESAYEKIDSSVQSLWKPSAWRVRPGEVRVDLVDPGFGDFPRHVEGFRLASPQQVYVDLARDRGRGREAAEHLRTQLLAG